MRVKTHYHPAASSPKWSSPPAETNFHLSPPPSPPRDGRPLYKIPPSPPQPGGSLLKFSTKSPTVNYAPAGQFYSIRRISWQNPRYYNHNNISSSAPLRNTQPSYANVYWVVKSYMSQVRFINTLWKQIRLSVETLSLLEWFAHLSRFLFLWRPAGV